MKDRVKKVMDHFKLKQKEFANELCVAEATISSIYNGRTVPSNKLVQAIHMAFPSINISWLMFGEGEMLLPLSPGVNAAGVSGSTTNAPSGNDDLFGQNVGFEFDEGPSLFNTGTFQPSSQAPQAPSQTPQVSQQVSTVNMESKLAEALLHLKQTKDVDRPVRKIKEIRVFYDDGTFEAFVPSSK